MAKADHRSIMAAIDKLYAAAMQPTRWQDFLATVATMFEAQNAFVSQIQYQPRMIEYIGLPQPGRDRVPAKRYEALVDEDPRTAVFNAGRGQPVHCRMGVSKERLHTSRVYRDYLEPLNIEYTMVSVLTVRDGVTQTLGFTRHRFGDPFDTDDCDLLRELVPHVERAFAIHRAFASPGGPPPRPAFRNLPDGEVDTLRRLFGLPPSHARLTISLFNGNSVKEAAAALGLTEGTARQYLKAIFERTGARRQADLIRVVGQALTP